MRKSLLSLIGVLLLLLLAAPARVQAQEFGLVGVVVRVEPAQDAFWLQESGPSSPSATEGRTWLVRVTSATDIGGVQGQSPDEARRTLRLLRVGDVVEVRGRLIGNNQLLARVVVVRSSNLNTFPQGRAITLTGSILDIEARGQGILQVQELSNGRGVRVWTVRVVPQTKVQGRWSREDEDTVWGDDGARRLRRGDLVEIDGRVIGNAQILATEIRLLRRTGFSTQPSPYPYPVPFSFQTVILSPQAGASVPASEFTVVGRTMPGAQVQIQVMARWALFQVQVANNTVTADGSGIFVAVVRPSPRLPGASYTITATSSFQGYTTTPVSVTVNQL